MVAPIEIRVPSTTDPEKYYTVIVDTELKIVECDCLGFMFMKRCKHIRFLKSVVKDLLHETPSFEREKHGL